MCGVAGAVGFGRPLGADDADVVREMIGMLRHRGPDDEGIWSSPTIVLGHARLSIIDTSAGGHQPMFSGSRRYAITFNGEIYNYRRLADEFRSTGWHPTGGSDTEVLLEAIERWGLDGALRRVDGMFALALADLEQGVVSLARDRFGEKPLAYMIDGHRLWFGSDVRVFRRTPGFTPTISPSAVRSLLRHGFIGGDDCIYEGVAKVPPGGIVSFSIADGRRTTSVYWSPPRPSATPPASTEAVAERLEELLTESVSRRMNSDRPLGAFLSGGIDSSLTCAIAAGRTTSLETFTMTWSDSEYDESEQAAKVAAHLGARHHQITVAESELSGDVRRLATMFDEPFADSSALAMMSVASFARRSVVVCLSGDGGDELFAGYNRHRWLLKVRRLRSIPAGVRGVASGALRRGSRPAQSLLAPIPTSRRQRLVGDKMRKLAAALVESDDESAYRRVLAHGSTDAPPIRIDGEVLAAMHTADPDDLLWAVRVADIMRYLPDDILTKVDRATMGVGLECRTPFLEPELCDFAMGLGRDQLIGRTGGKLPLRHLLDRLVPGVDFARPKSGFGVPIASMLRGGLRPDLHSAVASFDRRNLVPERSFGDDLSRFGDGDDSVAPTLWSVLMFELWFDATHGS